MKVKLTESTIDYIKFQCVTCKKEELIVADCDDLKEMKKDIKNGINPFKEGWEDGIGNTITCRC